MKRGSSAGGLKVKALGQTLRDAGSSPAWHYTFRLYNSLRENNYLFNASSCLKIPLHPRSCSPTRHWRDYGSQSLKSLT